MKIKHLFIPLCLIALITQAQKINKLPEYSLPKKELAAHIRFLASDEMLGRRTGEVTNNVAARYIAEQFRLQGLKTAEGQKDFLQTVPFEQVKPIKKGEVLVAGDSLKWTKDFIMLSGKATKLENVPAVFVGYGWVDANQDDYKGIDVKGKIVIAQFGIPNSDDPSENLRGSAKKVDFAAKNGAAAFIQLYNLKYPWPTITNFMGGEKLNLSPENPSSADIPHIWISNAHLKKFSKETLSTLSLNVSEVSKKKVLAYNVVGVLEGTDPVLKNEYVILSAHFDHVGTGRRGGAVTETDTIFNGARDNAFGTVAVLSALKSFTQKPTKRSILFIAYTGEEVGLLGSKYYAEHPLVPLKQCIYNLNCDGAGYNDTTKVTVIGLDRTDAQTQIETAAKAYGLTAISDPAPEQNLFDRSDNVNLAVKGIPAPDYSPGFTAFDAEINKFYHKVTDSPESISVDYLLKYCQSYTYAARLIADRPIAPKWKVGDKYEKAFNELYK
ncbi:peptidase M28 [Emticicia oligotrophica DSM 17448]|uniref:Peptidase M28 n=1 Tax=Emticicia oligotrophica (strain DSM 17448 / CIP 109782 / MTCC 6937 / GPTSA100-15) TaxID=929562 RepID=A0ABM5MX45_EMTOG|nr:M28 family peptidase [Emticicia oligotrophica]AFK01586.1 peptidase M28 [Emticicia oligotrophica DSM 17448]